MKNQTLCKDVVCKKKSLMMACECLRVLALLHPDSSCWKITECSYQLNIFQKQNKDLLKMYSMVTVSVI